MPASLGSWTANVYGAAQLARLAAWPLALAALDVRITVNWHDEPSLKTTRQQKDQLALPVWLSWSW